jgi:hypothetical protein
MREDVEWVLLDSERSALEQMAEALQGRSGVRAIHILAHGCPGEVRFHSGSLSLETIAEHRRDLDALREALALDGGLALWSCQTGLGHSGERFLTRLSEVLGATVLASTHQVGDDVRGGRWELDRNARSRSITAPLTKAALASYPGLLATNINVNKSATVNNSDATVNISGDNITVTVQGNNDLTTINGKNDVVTIAGTNDPVTLPSKTTGTALRLTAGNDLITLAGGSDTITITGNNDIVAITGSGDIVALVGNGDAVTLSANSTTFSLAASNDRITLSSSNDTVTVTGNSDTTTITGTGDRITVGSCREVGRKGWRRISCS